MNLVPGELLACQDEADLKNSFSCMQLTDRCWHLNEVALLISAMMIGCSSHLIISNASMGWCLLYEHEVVR